MATVNLFGDLALDNTVKATNTKLDELISARGEVAVEDQKGAVLLGVRRDGDATTVADGSLVGFAIDEEGRLKTSNKTASFAPTTATLNAAGSVLSVDVRRASNVVFHVKNTGAATAALTLNQFLFEASVDSTDGTNGTWFAIQAVRSNSNTVENGSIAMSLVVNAGAAYSWEASVNAYQFMRIRNAAVVAAGSATWIVQRGSYATEPIPAAQVTAAQPISGTVTATGTVTANWGTLPAGLPYSLVTAATTNLALIKTGTTGLYELTISNPTATPVYVKLFNKATVAPVLGTDTPVLTIPVSAAGAGTGGLVNISFGVIGKRFAAGLGIAVTGAAPAADATVAVAGVQVSATYI